MPRVRFRIGVPAVAVVLATALAGCAAPAGLAAPAGRAVASVPPTVGSSGAPVRPGIAARSPHAVAGEQPPPVAGTLWTALPTRSRGVARAFSAHPDPSTWLLWMDPRGLRFRFLPGLKYPEGSPVRAVDLQPSTWVPSLVAAFNGGFKLSDHVGGYVYAGRTVSPLRDGLASLVVGTDGSLRVVVWGRDVRSTRGLVAVRQNLPPLVDHGRSMTRSTDSLTTWGLTLHHIATANRSALGVLPDGSLVYVYVHDATAPALAEALVRLGVVTAIALDMNSGWPAALVFQHAGSRVSSARLSPVMHQFLTAYYARTTKDFIAVLAR
jgi:hypothetical protein